MFKRRRDEPAPAADPMRMPEGYKITTGMQHGYNMVFLFHPSGRLLAKEMIHTLTKGERAAGIAFRNLAGIARADAQWGS